MKQVNNTIDPGSLQEFLDSASNAAEQGQRQFFTPPALSQALVSCLPLEDATHVADLNMGTGHLLAATGIENLLGIDLDARCGRKPKGAKGKWEAYQADVTHWYPLAAEVNLRSDLFVLNPPFSLKWFTKRLAALAESSVPAVATTFDKFSGKDTIDSTLATFLIALDRLHRAGEAMMICNQDTAYRFFGDPNGGYHGSHPELRRHIWAWVTIPGAVYEGQHTAFDTAVLYFAPGHREEDPHHIVTPSNDTTTVAKTITKIARNRALYRRGHCLNSRTAAWNTTSAAALWYAIKKEYGERHRGNQSDWNISLSKLSGRINRHLTPFQNSSARFDGDAIRRLDSLQGKSPMELVIQRSTRLTLLDAARGGLWTVQPELLEAIDQAIADYEAVSAPFYQPNEVQALGWIDESSELHCHTSGLEALERDSPYPMATEIVDTVWETTKPNLAGGKDKVEHRGKELVISISSLCGKHTHKFHYRRDDKLPPIQEDERNGTFTHHHNLPLIFNYFTIPIPKDIAQLKPKEYQTNLETMKKLETIISHQLQHA